MSADQRVIDFGQRPFYAEPVRGVRAWRFCYCGGEACRRGLLALARPSAWAPGENVAECQPGLRFSEPGRFVHETVAGAGCTCGFYAYFDGSSRQVRRGPDTVLGIIEGYGTVTVGSLGFRASKARVVAFVRHWRCVIGDVPELDATLATYGVPIYDTLEEALAAHPLTKPADVGVEAPPEQPPGHIAALADLAAAMGVSAQQAAAGFERLMAALAETEPAPVRYRPGRLVVARGGFLPGVGVSVAQSDEANRIVVGFDGTASVPSRRLNPLELKRRRQEAAAEQRRSAGLRGSGGFDKKGRRR